MKKKITEGIKYIKERRNKEGTEESNKNGKRK